MPIDLEKISNDKSRIISYIKINGPSLPVRISNYLKMQTLFVSAFLSELNSEKKVIMSHMKVGSSPLYYLKGQEDQLERFLEHLNSREREAFQLLKENNVLEDEKLSPVMRVAMRSINDFAIPVRARINEEIKIFWKYHLVQETELKDLLENLISGKTIPSKEEEPQKENKKESQETSKEVKEENKEENPQEQLLEVKKSKPKEKKKAPSSSEFTENIDEYLEAKDIEILERILQRKKEYQAKIRIDTLFGKQTYLLHAKEKKKVNENDLTILHQKSQSEKLPGIYMCTGEPDKKALEYLSKWQNLVKFERLKF